jgi:hypothetical protein
MKPWLLAALVTFATASAAAVPAAGPVPTADELARLAFRNDLLQKQLDLAKGKDFYLILNPADKSLELMYRAALLQSYRVDGLEIGVPRVLFRERVEASAWEGRIWRGGALDPARELDRVEMQAPPPTPEGQEVEVKVPQTPEEKYPVPARYHIRFEGGLSIEVRPPGSEAEKGFWERLGERWSTWWTDAKAASKSEPDDTVRLHIVLSKKDAESLYRALPPNTALLVVPPRP